ncbi:nucleoside recognition protein [Paenibacillus sp. P96]|uniref:Nucleoside recognition protein n=1 Tax=Paenibacillus zeirhizosphaerae TaxID=2987519 RepID=A0ABT9FS74_9BACL|nr:nucleoside recognition domain-containing protein [Paenibacillus sp. P96]MDP4097589.1 nucleoside recognition protein [Paenibacillus sp. P96]
METIQEKQPGQLWTTWLLGACSLLLVAAVVAAPAQVYEASGQGLKLWWSIVFPALLPFLMLSEMLIASGFVHGLGVLLTPLMRTCFGLPGRSGWVLALGLTAGSPAAAEAARQLANQGELEERQVRLLTSTAHFCNPMTILLVIGAGFLHSPATGYLLLLVHWITGIATGMISVRLFGTKEKTVKQDTQAATPRGSVPRPSILQVLYTEIATARQRDGRSFGRLLGETVSNAVQTLMLTGGFIIFFAVMIRLLNVYLTPMAPMLLWPGLLEQHLGAYAAVRFLGEPHLQAATISAVLGWGGVSGWLQIVSMTRPADKGFTFAVTRLLHAGMAFLTALILWAPWQQLTSFAVPAYLELLPVQEEAIEGSLTRTLTLATAPFALLAVILGMLLTASLMIGWRNHRSSR